MLNLVYFVTLRIFNPYSCKNYSLRLEKFERTLLIAENGKKIIYQIK